MYIKLAGALTFVVLLLLPLPVTMALAALITFLYAREVRA